MNIEPAASYLKYGSKAIYFNSRYERTVTCKEVIIADKWGEEDGYIVLKKQQFELVKNYFKKKRTPFPKIQLETCKEAEYFKIEKNTFLNEAHFDIFFTLAKTKFDAKGNPDFSEQIEENKCYEEDEYPPYRNIKKALRYFMTKKRFLEVKSEDFYPHDEDECSYNGVGLISHYNRNFQKI